MDRIGANYFITALLTLPTHLLVAAGLLAALVLSFVVFFLIPAIAHWFRLRHLQAGIGALPGRTPPGEFRRLFAPDSRLAHLWKEYQDSLHVQREERDGQMQAVAVRSTLPAETFFNSQYVVDARLRTEFFKHLPGIFTGIGIIGTFTGLIEGLRQFQVSENAATVRASLESLMHSVGEAFLISASAIAAAMIATFLEKLLLASLYGRTEEIAHSIDARFDAGAGEDYLSRLVKASEDSASQAKTLKDALVKELADVMRESSGAQISAMRDQQALATQQIEEASRKRTEAARQDAERLGATISDSIEKSLRAPLQGIADIVQAASGDQSARASQMLQEVMGRFSERLDTLFGGQVAGITELNRQTAEALQTTLATAGQQISDVLATMSDSQRHVLDSNRDREQAMMERTNSAMGTMSQTVEQALKEMSDASAQMSHSVQALTKTTATSLDKMNAGAAHLESASRGFAAAGERVSGVMGQASDVSLKLVQASSSLSAGATTMQDGLGDYRLQREAVGHVVSELRATVELARKEASLTADVLSRIEGSAERLSDAQKQADQYLSGVSKVLGDAHQAFATSVKKTLELANTEFHTKLATAVGLLSSTIGELEATIGNVAPQRH
jgi:hypothetical protein